MDSSIKLEPDSGALSTEKYHSAEAWRLISLQNVQTSIEIVPQAMSAKSAKRTTEPNLKQGQKKARATHTRWKKIYEDRNSIQQMGRRDAVVSDIDFTSSLSNGAEFCNDEFIVNNTIISEDNYAESEYNNQEKPNMYRDCITNNLNQPVSTALPCSICQKVVSKVNLKRHMKIHASSNSQDNNSLNHHTCMCVTCLKTFRDRSCLEVHTRIHTGEKPYICTCCHKAFSQKCNLNSHMRLHTGERPYACDICQDAFKEKSLLKLHMQKHSGEHPFVCDICQKAFTRNANLKSHMQVHIGERPYSCDICNKSFVKKSNLKLHMLIHSEERPHVCRVCNKAFRRKSKLQFHERIHTGDKSFKCHICEKGFAQNAYLIKHMQRHKKGMSYIDKHLELNWD